MVASSSGYGIFVQVADSPISFTALGRSQVTEVWVQTVALDNVAPFVCVRTRGGERGSMLRQSCHGTAQSPVPRQIEPFNDAHPCGVGPACHEPRSARGRTGYTAYSYYYSRQLPLTGDPTCQYGTAVPSSTQSAPPWGARFAFAPLGNDFPYPLYARLRQWDSLPLPVLAAAASAAFSTF